MSNERIKFEKKRINVLKRSLKEIKNYGFNKNMLLEASKKCDLSEGELGRLFPEGLYELKELFFYEVDKEMMKLLNKANSDNIRVREKIYNGVIYRLEIFQKNKDAVKYILVSGTTNPIESFKNLWNTADLIWKAAGDNSTDYNHYTKRLLLSWVYISTILCWFNDKDENLNETKLFCIRRIDEVLKFGKQSATIKGKISNLNISNKLIATIKELKSIQI